MPLINFEVNLILTWSSACVISNSTGIITFPITSTQDNVKLLQQLKQVLIEQSAGINIYQNQNY